jgi:hypothetical protein
MFTASAVTMSLRQPAALAPISMARELIARPVTLSADKTAPPQVIDQVRTSGATYHRRVAEVRISP